MTHILIVEARFYTHIADMALDGVKAALAAGAVRGESSDAIKQRFIRLQQEFEQGTPPADDTAFIVIGEYNCHRT